MQHVNILLSEWCLVFLVFLSHFYASYNDIDILIVPCRLLPSCQGYRTNLFAVFLKFMSWIFYILFTCCQSIKKDFRGAPFDIWGGYGSFLKKKKKNHTLFNLAKKSSGEMVISEEKKIHPPVRLKKKKKKKKKIHPSEE